MTVQLTAVENVQKLASRKGPPTLNRTSVDYPIRPENGQNTCGLKRQEVLTSLSFLALALG